MVLTSEVLGPVVHEPPPLEQVRVHVGRLSTLFRTTWASAASTTLPGMVRLLGRPDPKARPELIRHGRDPVPLEEPGQPLAAQRLPALGDEHDGALTAAQPPRRIEDLESAATQRHPVLARGLHSARGNRPDALRPVDLAPHRPADLRARGIRFQVVVGNLLEPETTRPKDKFITSAHGRSRQVIEIGVLGQVIGAAACTGRKLGILHLAGSVLGEEVIVVVEGCSCGVKQVWEVRVDEREEAIVGLIPDTNVMISK